MKRSGKGFEVNIALSEGENSNSSLLAGPIGPSPANYGS